MQRLQGELAARGKDVWIDVEGIRDAEVFPVALARAIEGSDAFVFVISPDSVHSEFCEHEVAHADELRKRIVPLALREVPDAEIPDGIRFRNWIPAGQDGDFETAVDRVLAAIETDLDWEHQHTRLTVKALEWDQGARDASFLLRGSELAAAEQWLAAGADKDPGPSVLEQEYLLAARNAASRRQRALLGASLVVAAVAVGLLIFALISRGQAVSEAHTANAEAQTAKSRALAAESQTQLVVDPERAVLLAIDAVRTVATSDAMFALEAALDASPIRYRLPDAGLQTCGPPASNGTSLSPGVAFSPDGHEIAEGLCNGTVILADASTGHVIRTIRVPQPAGPVVYSHDGSELAIVGADRILVLDPSTGAITRRGPRLIGFGRVAFSPVAPVVAIPRRGGVTLWNIRTDRTRVLPFALDLAPSGALAFSPDGRRIAVALQYTGPGQPGLVLMDTVTGRTLATSATPTDDVSFSPDGRELADAETSQSTLGGSIVLRDARTLAVRRTLVRLPYVEAAAVAFSPNGAQLAYGGYDGTAGLVSAATGQPVISYLGQTAAVSQVAFSADGRLVATGSEDGTLRVWRATGLELRTAAVGGAVNTLVPNGGGFVTLAQPGARGGVEVQSFSRDGGVASPPLVLSSTSNVDAAFLSSDGRLAGLIPSDPSGEAPIRIWDVAERRVTATVPTSMEPSGGEPAFSPTASTLAMAKPIAQAAGTSFMLVDVHTGRTRTLGTTGCAGGWRGYTFSRGGNLVAAGSFCGEVDVWNVATGKPVGRPFSINGELAELAFSPDGQRIAAASWNDTVTVADVNSGRVVAVLTGHTRGVPDLAYSPDGRYLATASLDDTVRVWDAHSLTLLRVIQDPAPAFGVAFTPGSRDLLTYDSSGVVREWDACIDCENPRALVALAETRVTRRLTPREQQAFGVN